MLLAIAAIISVSATETANAMNPATSVAVNANVKVDVGVGSQNEKIQASSSSSVSATVRDNATSSAKKSEKATSSPDMKKEVETDNRQNAVAEFVQSLLSVADREGGIGAQVRTVAQSQNDSASTTATAMLEVEKRGSVRTFLFGSDYKNLGVIKREIATTTTNINDLKEILDETTDNSSRAELTVQIEFLEDELAKMEAYVDANEAKFSVFGWFNRLFVK